MGGKDGGTEIEPDEGLRGRFASATLMGILLKTRQDVVFQTFEVPNGCTHEGIRSYVINVVNSRAQLNKPNLLNASQVQDVQRAKGGVGTNSRWNGGYGMAS